MSDINLLKDIRPETLSDHVLQRLHKSQNISQANIDIIEVKGKPFVLKHFFDHPLLVRNIWGRFVIGREWRNYRILQGIKGIPKIHLQREPYSIIMEYVDGKRLPHLNEFRLSPRFFERLRILIKEIHNRGTTHGDLRRKNILVVREEFPFLIDFAGAFHLKGKGNFITRAIFRRLKNVDNITVLKLQNYYFPGTLTAAETAQLQSMPWYLRLGRFLKRKVYRPFKHTTRGTRKKKKTIS